MTGPVRDHDECRWRHDMREHRRDHVFNGGTHALLREQSVRTCLEERLELPTMVDASKDVWNASAVTKPAVTMPTTILCCVPGSGRAYVFVAPLRRSSRSSNAARVSDGQQVDTQCGRKRVYVAGVGVPCGVRQRSPGRQTAVPHEATESRGGMQEQHL